MLSSVKNSVHIFCLFIAAAIACQHNIGSNTQTNIKRGRNYYLDAAGNDANDGSKTKPWKTINKIYSTRLQPGDSVSFTGGQIFTGRILLDAASQGTKENPIVLTSAGNTKATIDAGNESGLWVLYASYIRITNLHFTGSGRKTGNTQNGVFINMCKHIFIDSLSIDGFQKSGLLVYKSSDVEINRVYAHDNGNAGILVNGETDKNDCRNISIQHCFAENNPGDPTNFTNHSGNGILVGFSRNVIIDYCSATNNGWDMPRIGNGPVGIWAYESDSVLIQHCISYRNKTSPGASDGGGFDLDGGVSNSTIQYCLTYENQGSGFGIFQYAGASNWYNNTVRFNISENDGVVTAKCAGMLIWNSSRDSSQFRDFFFYNNTIYNAKAPAIAYDSESENAGFHFYNNIFVGNDSIITGKETSSTYLGNNWYSLKSGFNIGGFSNFQDWANINHKEKINGANTGSNINPLFTSTGNATLVQPSLLSSFNNYQLPANSILHNSGINLLQLFGINNGGKTFNGKTATIKLTGAVE